MPFRLAARHPPPSVAPSAQQPVASEYEVDMDGFQLRRAQLEQLGKLRLG